MAQIDIFQRRIGTSHAEDTTQYLLLMDILTAAQDAINEVRYPFADLPETLEARFNSLQINIAVIIYNKMGAEGQSSHSENGISRNYTEITAELKAVTPYVGTPDV